MTSVVGVIKLRQHMAEYIRRAEQGEAFVIVRNNEAVARLVPARKEPMSEERATYNTEQPAPEEADRLVALFAPRLVHQVLEQCWQDKRTARRVLLAALLKMEE